MAKGHFFEEKKPRKESVPSVWNQVSFRLRDKVLREETTKGRKASTDYRIFRPVHLYCGCHLTTDGYDYLTEKPEIYQTVQQECEGDV